MSSDGRVGQVVSLLEAVNATIMLDAFLVLPIGSKVMFRGERGGFYCMVITGVQGLCMYEGRVLDVVAQRIKGPPLVKGRPVIFVSSNIERVVSLPERCLPMEEWNRW
jgi:hypothetical protein